MDRLDRNEEYENLFPLKIFYITPCFRNEVLKSLSTTKTRQFDQVGLEILGVQNKNVDLESILIIVKGLEFLGLNSQNITIRLSDLQIFNRLAEASNLGILDKVKVKEYLDKIAETRAMKAYKEENRFRKLLNDFLKEKTFQRI